MAKKPYLLRRNEEFERHSSFVQDVPSHYPRYGTNIPAVPVLRATPSVISKQIASVLILATSATFVHTKRLYKRMLPAFSKTRSRRSITSHETSQCAFPLMSLPNEIILQVMCFLSPISLYSLRQTSPIFMAFFDSKLFKAYHQQSTSLPNHMAFDLQMLCDAEKNVIADYLHHNMYCNSCIAAAETGIVEERLRALRRLRYCRRCQREHSNALFFPEDGEEHGGKSNRGTCMGRLGHITPCNHHSCKSFTWHDVEWRVWRSGFCVSACTDRSHEPESEYIHQFYMGGCPFPRLVVSSRLELRQVSSIFDLGYGWDLPLLTVNWTTAPPLAVIKKTIFNLLENAFQIHRLCQHISINKEIRDFVESGICSCFRKYVDIDCYNFHEGCQCGRQTTLQCRVCGAVYMWLYFSDRVILSMRYAWSIERPTSLGWLGLINKEKFFTAYNKHVLWCDEPECRTNKQGRWETLVKENAKREAYQVLGGSSRQGLDVEEAWNTSQEDYTNEWDCREVWKASQLGSLQSW